jgi:hypothetical protein
MTIAIAATLRTRRGGGWSLSKDQGPSSFKEARRLSATALTAPAAHSTVTFLVPPQSRSTLVMETIRILVVDAIRITAGRGTYLDPEVAGQ